MSCLRLNGPQYGTGPTALVCEAQLASGELSREIMQHLRELHPDLLDALPPPLVELLQQSVQQHGVRWLCVTAKWWAEHQCRGNEERCSRLDDPL